MFKLYYKKKKKDSFLCKIFVKKMKKIFTKYKLNILPEHCMFFLDKSGK